MGSRNGQNMKKTVAGQGTMQVLEILVWHGHQDF